MSRLRCHRQDGFVLKAREHGGASASAPLVLLVHGMMEPGSVWQPVVDALVLHHGARCVTLELPWNGEQGGLWGQTRDATSWLQLALAVFDLRPDAWVAHSFGASTLLALMGKGDPDHQAPAVLISPFYKACHSELTWPLFERYVAGFTDFVELSIRTRLGTRSVLPSVLQRMTRNARDSFGCYVWMQFWQLFSAMPFLPMHSLHQPVLTLAGANDDSTPLQDMHALTRNLPNARLEVYAGASHFLLTSRRSAVIDATRRFIGAHCQRPRTELQSELQFDLSAA